MAIKESVLANGTSPHVAQTTISYYLDPSKGGYKEFYPGTAGSYRRKHEVHAFQVTDIKGHEKEFSLDREGFTFVQRESKEKDFENEEVIKDRLYPEISELVKDV